MALQASGAISMGNINTELGLSATALIGMNDAAVRTLLGVASGAISLSNAYGKSNVTLFRIYSTNATTNAAAPSLGGPVGVDTAGNLYCFSPRQDYATHMAKFSASGTELWQKSTDIDRITEVYNINPPVLVDSSSNVHVLHRSGDSTYGYVSKFNTSGGYVWKHRIRAHTDQTYGRYYALGLDTSGNTYVFGYANVESAASRHVLVKLDSSGTLQASEYWNTTSQIRGRMTHDGTSLYGYGSATPYQSNGTGYTVWKMNPATFAVTASAECVKLNNNNNNSCYTGSYDATNNVHYAVGATFLSSSKYGGGIVKYNSSLVAQWVSLYERIDSFDLLWHNSRLDSSGNLYVFGVSEVPENTNPSDKRFWIAKFNSSGTIQWAREGYVEENTGTNPQKAIQKYPSMNQENYTPFLTVAAGFLDSASVSAGQRGLVFKFPFDGTKTGTYTLGVGGRSLIYGTGEGLRDLTGTITTNAATSDVGRFNGEAIGNVFNPTTSDSSTITNTVTAL